MDVSQGKNVLLLDPIPASMKSWSVPRFEIVPMIGMV